MHTLLHSCTYTHIYTHTNVIKKLNFIQGEKSKQIVSKDVFLWTSWKVVFRWVILWRRQMITCSVRISERTSSWVKTMRKEIEQKERQHSRAGRAGHRKEGEWKNSTEINPCCLYIWIAIDTESLQAWNLTCVLKDSMTKIDFSGIKTGK